MLQFLFLHRRLLYKQSAGLRQWIVQNNYCDPPKLSLLNPALPFLLTPWVHIDFLPSEKLTKVRENLWSCGLSLFLGPGSLALVLPLFSFLLVSSSGPSPHSVNHACPSRPSLPVPNKLFRSLGSWGEGEKGRSEEKGTRVHIGEEQSVLYATGTLLSDTGWHESWSPRGDKDGEGETNSSILFQLHVRKSNDLVLNPKHSVDVNCVLH